VTGWQAQCYLWQVDEHSVICDGLISTVSFVTGWQTQCHLWQVDKDSVICDRLTSTVSLVTGWQAHANASTKKTSTWEADTEYVWNHSFDRNAPTFTTTKHSSEVYADRTGWCYSLVIVSTVCVIVAALHRAVKHGKLHELLLSAKYFCDVLDTVKCDHELLWCLNRYGLNSTDLAVEKPHPASEYPAMYIDSLQPLVYYRLNSAVLVYTPLITPLYCIHVRGCYINTRGL